MRTQQVTIIGVGLIGGSLGMALRGSGHYQVCGIGRHQAKLRAAKRRGAVDTFTVDYAAGVRDADVVVVCTPVDHVAPIIKTILPLCKPGAIITDAGSVKGCIIKDVARVFSAHGIHGSQMPAFVGAHPMAGIEKSGVESASAHLYKDATIVIAGTVNASRAQMDVIKQLWRHAGGRIVEMDPVEHDVVVALTSHVPHVVAYGLAGLAETLKGKHRTAAQLMAGSFKDATRVAASNPGDWARICRANGTEISKAITALIRFLTDTKKRINSVSSLEKLFEKGHRARCKLK
ncbi:MAG: prephenate dehydrogenase/arogenate dehydrogenase family protein [Endomicrobiales bacterium]|jgi:prephenate dehydrogenase